MGSPKGCIELQRVSKVFVTTLGVVQAIRDLSFVVNRHEFVSLVGPSGCGKSTCLSLISGLQKPTIGSILLNGEPIQGPNRNVGYMLQKDLLMPWRTVMENVLFGLEIRRVNIFAARSKAEAYLDKYGLRGFENLYPWQLSGGMRQRVALIRTLVLDPEIILLDEPFSSLDFQTRLMLEEEICRILREEHKTVFLITHDISEAIAVSDRVLVMTRRPGRIKAEFEIQLARGAGSPIEARKAQEFNDYFVRIWKELEVDVRF